MAAPPPKKAGGLSLYADLLDPSSKQQQPSGSIISAAPVKYDLQRSGSNGQDDAQQKKKDGIYPRLKLYP
jgi:hypothetical protein